MSQSTR